MSTRETGFIEPQMILLLLLLFVSLVSAGTCTTEAKLITSLPDWDSADAFPTMWSGFVCVNETMGTHYYFTFIRSVEPSDDLVIWYQGGPGANGLVGLVFENGNLQMRERGGIGRRTTGNWNKRQNFVYIDQPSGVGFSYSSNVTDYTLNDDFRSAKNNLVFLHNFLADVWPKVAAGSTALPKNLYFAGESYAGAYIPMLASLAIKDRLVGSLLRGVAIGNPVFRCTSIPTNVGNLFERVNLLYWHGYVDYATFDRWVKAGCNVKAPPENTASSPVCREVYDHVMSKQQLGSDFDPDNLFSNFCTSNASLTFAETPAHCANSYINLMSRYYQRQDVLDAIHAPRGYTAPKNWKYNQNAGNLIPFYNDFIGKIRILIYSGTLDIETVPFAFTMPCLSELSPGPLQRPWAPWYYSGHTAGRVQAYDHYTYATVRGAGHEVPAYQPLLAEQLWTRWFTNTLVNEEEGGLGDGHPFKSHPKHHWQQWIEKINVH